MTSIKLHKPNVGVLSMQRVINYGSFLQAYGLRQLLLQNGAESVSFMDIEPGRILVDCPSNTVRRVKELFKLIMTGQIVERLRTHHFFPKVKRTFLESAWAQLGLENPDHTKFDLIVIGSDEVFNCCQESGAGYTPQLFGRIRAEVAPKVITYAASFGYTTLPMLKQYGVADEIADTLKDDEAISVRDVNSQDIVESLIGSRPPLHLDPVLMYGFKKEIEVYTESPTDEKYMIVYSYPERIKSREEVNAIRRFAKQNNLKIYCIFCYYNWGDRVVIPENPMEVLKWFKFAECIVTDTFHGTIFSVITHSRFGSFIRTSNRNKLVSLLESVGLVSQSVDRPCELSEKLLIDIDYSSVENRLDIERARTNSYLKQAIQE
ncbi:MAG: polysaccharide pyruvyl transferase family protein [Muribaculaceae bacterium]|nr:polysaccharide pyruvyl transferase family protein [Muribaculaceae bacterium]